MKSTACRRLLVGATTLILAGLTACTASPPQPTPDPLVEAADRAAQHAEVGHYTAAAATLREALDAHPDAQLALGLAELYVTWGRPEPGFEAVARARELGANEGALLALVRRLALLARDWRLAEATAKAELAASPNAIEPLSALLQVHLQTGDCDEAEAVADRLVELGTSSRQDTETQYFLKGDYSAPRQRPMIAVDLDDCGDACDYDAALALVRAERWAEAACLLARVVKATGAADGAAAPELGTAYAWLGEAEARTGHPLRAESALRQAVSLAPESPLAWLLLGKQRLTQGDLETARVGLINAQRLDPANPAPCLAIAELKAQAGAYDEIERWIDAAVERAPQDVEVLKAAARFYLSRDLADIGDPQELADQARQLAPTDAEAHVLGGWAALSAGQPDVALVRLDLALGLDPGSAEAHHLRGLALAGLGRSAEAEVAYIRAADLGW